MQQVSIRYANVPTRNNLIFNVPVPTITKADLSANFAYHHVISNLQSSNLADEYTFHYKATRLLDAASFRSAIINNVPCYAAEFLVVRVWNCSFYPEDYAHYLSMIPVQRERLNALLVNKQANGDLVVPLNLSAWSEKHLSTKDIVNYQFPDCYPCTEDLEQNPFQTVMLPPLRGTLIHNREIIRPHEEVYGEIILRQGLGKESPKFQCVSKVIFQPAIQTNDPLEETNTHFIFTVRLVGQLNIEEVLTAACASLQL